MVFNDNVRDAKREGDEGNEKEKERGRESGRKR